MSFTHTTLIMNSLLHTFNDTDLNLLARTLQLLYSKVWRLVSTWLVVKHVFWMFGEFSSEMGSHVGSYTHSHREKSRYGRYWCFFPRWHHLPMSCFVIIYGLSAKPGWFFIKYVHSCNIYDYYKTVSSEVWSILISVWQITKCSQ